MTSRTDTAEEQWKRLMAGEQPSRVMSVPASRQVQTPHEIKADERTRLVREMTDDATDQRLANVARLREARLSKEAQDKADDKAQAAPRKRSGRSAE